jgi:voltage-gated potassium channel Kch
MHSTRNGIVRINEHTVELPEDEARTLFLAAAALTRRGGPIAINNDTMIAVTSATRVSIDINNGFNAEYNPQQVLDQATRGRSALVM